jgi:hypothetical protein
MRELGQRRLDGSSGGDPARRGPQAEESAGAPAALAALTVEEHDRVAGRDGEVDRVGERPPQIDLDLSDRDPRRAVARPRVQGRAQ